MGQEPARLEVGFFHVKASGVGKRDGTLRATHRSNRKVSDGSPLYLGRAFEQRMQISADANREA